VKRKTTLADKLILVLLMPGLSIYDRAVLQYLIWRQGDHDKTWPGIRTIARELSICPNTVQSCINKLRRSRYLSVGQIRCPKGKKNTYAVRLGVVPANGTSAYQQMVHNFKQLTRTDPAFEEPVGQKAGAERETIREKIIRKSIEETITRRDQLKHANANAKKHKTTNPPDKEVKHGSK